MSYTKVVFAAVLLLTLLPILAGGCSTANTPVINDVVDTQTAYKMIQNNQSNSNFVIVDVRTREEFNSGHIAKAIMVDYESPDFTARISELDRNREYIIYCRTARRSGLAVKVMKGLGFTETYDMAGGITKWQAEGLPVVMN